MKRVRPHVPLAALLLALGAQGVVADLLVTREGATIETAGPWRVDGRRIVFTLPNGALSSIRTDEVDLDKSALATARAAEAANVSAAEKPAPAVQPILTLKEDDLSTVTDSGEEVEAANAQAPAPAVVPLQIESWEQMPMEGGDGVQIFGTVKNNGTSHLTAVRVTAILYGPEGGMLANGDAELNQRTIAPGARANFRIEFPGLPSFASARFTTAARGFEGQPAEGEGEEASGDNPEEGAPEPPPAAESAAPPPAR